MFYVNCANICDPCQYRIYWHSGAFDVIRLHATKHDNNNVLYSIVLKQLANLRHVVPRDQNVPGC